MELYADVVAFANTEAPFNIGPKRKSARYVLLDEQPIYRGDGATCMCVLHVLIDLGVCMISGSTVESRKLHCYSVLAGLQHGENSGNGSEMLT